MSLVRCGRAAGWCGVAARRIALSVTIRAVSSSASDAPSLTSSAHLWEAAMNDFYAEFCLSTRPAPPSPHQHGDVPATASASSSLAPFHVERLTTAAAAAMQRCLDVGRASEALEVYRTVCSSGLVGISSASVTRAAATRRQPPTTRQSPDSATTATVSASLDELARRALVTVPHHRGQHAMLALLMAAEQEASIEHPSTRPAQRRVAGAAAATSTWATAELLGDVQPPSAAEQARIRVQQRLHTLHSTQHLRQPLGKACCLVEMLDITTPARGACATSATVTSAAAEMEVDPLRTLSRIVLLHPFTHTTPTASAAQQELLWEDMRTSAGAALGLGAADVARLAAIEASVQPYRDLCASSLNFMAQFVPDWDAVLVRRVAETLVLPAAAHNVFPEAYRRTRSSGAGARGRRTNALATVTAEAPTTAGETAAQCASWTDSAAHHLFPAREVTSTRGAPPRSCGGVEDHIESSRALSPMQRVECIVRRRVHHDLVVPDTAYVLQRFHQLKQLARHREVIITHRVFLDLVAVAAAASLPAQPTRFHARRILHEIMLATTTARTAADAAAAPAITAAGALGGSEWSTASRAARRRSQHGLPSAGFTLLGLQDELALLEHCAERFFLSEGQLPAEATSDWALMGDHHHHPAQSTTTAATAAPLRPLQDGSSTSVVLVAKQLERMIAAHDRGEAFAASFEPPGAATACCSAPPPDVDALVQHILEGNPSATSAADSLRVPDSRVSGDTLFQNRSRGRWARLPMLVATTQDSTRAAAFTIGLSMHPPAGVVA